MAETNITPERAKYLAEHTQCFFDYELPGSKEEGDGVFMHVNYDVDRKELIHRISSFGVELIIPNGYAKEKGRTSIRVLSQPMVTASIDNFFAGVETMQRQLSKRYIAVLEDMQTLAGIKELALLVNSGGLHIEEFSTIDTEDSGCEESCGAQNDILRGTYVTQHGHPLYAKFESDLGCMGGTQREKTGLAAGFLWENVREVSDDSDSEFYEVLEIAGM